MTVPVTVEYAVMIREEDKFVTSGQRPGNGDIPRPSRSAVRLQNDVIDVAIRQGVLQRARVIHDVDARERRGLNAHAVEQSKQALQVPPGANVAGNDQCTHHGVRTLRSFAFASSSRHAPADPTNVNRDFAREMPT